MDELPNRIVIVVDAGLSRGLLANTVATIAIGIDAGVPGFGWMPIEDADGCTIAASATTQGVPILAAGQSALADLLLRARPTRWVRSLTGSRGLLH